MRNSGGSEGFSENFSEGDGIHGNREIRDGDSLDKSGEGLFPDFGGILSSAQGGNGFLSGDTNTDTHTDDYDAGAGDRAGVINNRDGDTDDDGSGSGSGDPDGRYGVGEWAGDPAFRVMVDALYAVREDTAVFYRAVQVLHDRARRDAEVLAAQVDAEAEAALASGVKPRRVRRGFEVRALAERSFVAEFACAIREHEVTARNLLTDAAVLMGKLPGALDALEAGAITVRQAQCMVEHAVFLPDEALPGFEEASLEKAAVQTSSRFRHTARVLRERLHPESIQVRKRAADQNRRIDCAPTQDGMSWLGLYVTSEYATGITARLHAHAIELATHEDESRTKAQLEADIAVDLLLNGTTAPAAPRTAVAVPTAGAMPSPDSDTATNTESSTRSSDTTTGAETAAETSGTEVGTDMATESTETTTDTATGAAGGITGAGVRAVVYVTVPVLSLLGRSDEPAELEGVGPIDIETARVLCAGATSFYRILTHPVTGAYLSVGRESYRPPKDLKRFLEIRDRTCRFPGCARKVTYCDTDHTVAWAEGGETSAQNLSHLCRNHHRLKHETGWNVTQAGDGELVWTSPAGMVYTTVPEYPETSNAPEHQKQGTQKPKPKPADLWNTQASDYTPGNNPAPF